MVKLLKNTILMPNNINFTEEERNTFAMSFLVFALSDPRAKALIDSKSPVKTILDLYKDRPFIDLNPENQ